MDPFHERLARVGLVVLEPYGFALAGGYAVAAYGIVHRPSEDVDLFAGPENEAQFSDAVRDAVGAYISDGLQADVTVEGLTFARLTVTDPASTRSAQVELAVDWRRDPPTILNVGPVLSRDDAVANKVSALYSRGQARDYIDVHAALLSDHYSRTDLLTLAEDHDPGFDRLVFAQALYALRRLPATEFAAYGLDEQQVARLTHELLDWADELATGSPPSSSEAQRHH
jgi:hypothetical protein